MSSVTDVFRTPGFWIFVMLATYPVLVPAAYALKYWRLRK